METKHSLESKANELVRTPNSHDLAVAIINLQKDVNIGGIVRTASAAALSGVIIVGRRRWNKSPAVGAHRKIPIRKFTTIEKFLDYSTSQGYNLVSVEIGKDAENIFEYTYPPRTLLVIGSEGSGIPRRILEVSKGKIYIPQYGDIECLNAAVSGSIAIYDWIRKKAGLPTKGIDGQKFCSYY